MKIYKEILGRAAAKLRRVPLRFRVELVKEVPKGGGMWYNKHRRSGNPCIFRDSRLFCYYRVISSAFNGL